MSYWDGTRWLEDVPAASAPPPRRARRILGAAAEAALVTTLIFGLIATTAFAAKGENSRSSGNGGHGGKATSSLSLVILAPPDANYGEQVTFDVSTSATDQPMVRLNCFQDGVEVYWASAGFYPDYPWQWAQDFTLRSDYWTGGAASCTATLYLYDGRRFKDLSSLSFGVAG